jgi:hypothetical protein
MNFLRRLFCSDENLDSFRSIQFMALVMEEFELVILTKVVEFFLRFPYCYNIFFLDECTSRYQFYNIVLFLPSESLVKLRG